MLDDRWKDGNPSEVEELRRNIQVGQEDNKLHYSAAKLAFRFYGFNILFPGNTKRCSLSLHSDHKYSME